MTGSAPAEMAKLLCDDYAQFGILAARTGPRAD